MDIIWWIVGIIGYLIIGIATAKLVSEEKDSAINVWLIIGFWWIAWIYFGILELAKTFINGFWLITDWIKK